MELFYSAIRSLIGIAILYFLSDMLVTSEKYKPYVGLILGLAIAVTMAKPISVLLNRDWAFSFDVSSSSATDTSYRDTIEHIWQERSEASLNSQLHDLLKKKLPENSFTVRTYKHNANTYRIYIDIKSSLPQAQLDEIKAYICSETGISADYVNIYLQDK